MGRAPGTADRLTGRRRPLRYAAIAVVVVLVVAALAALDVLSGVAPPSREAAGGTAATQPSPSIRPGSVNAPPLAPTASPTQPGEPMRAPTGNPSIDQESGLRTIHMSALPKAAVLTLALIDAGGPFPHPEDGATFHNLEGLLPGHGDGYYREFTVETPGSPDRGPRRIVAGARGERYWTNDHYATFRRIVL